ncbi:hypothetical protein HQQ94_12315 [Shewanella sp. VB17]|uniref:imm11 family protein n=1 Tax=Shewanella sp. VB17 TaxID=2739432 RepID=UPI001566DA6F|nr:DUF1629 domain-containing protein [Shewanella sp. VB17]NRD74008.1 hypothetical protein [Shewanella sp. VB17]
MYWIMSSERSKDNEVVLEIQSSSLSNQDVGFSTGESQLVIIKEIILHYQLGEGTNLYTDNLICYGAKGLIVNKKIKELLEELGVGNIDFYNVNLVNIKDNTSISYYLANVIGAFECVDYEHSDIELWPNGKIEQIDALAFIDTSEMDLPPIFRLSSFLPLVIVNDEIKQAFEANNITGFKFYKPEDFYL